MFQDHTASEGASTWLRSCDSEPRHLSSTLRLPLPSFESLLSFAKWLMAETINVMREKKNFKETVAQTPHIVS